MRVYISIILSMAGYTAVSFFSINPAYTEEATREWDNIYEVPPLPKDTVLWDHEKQFAYRGRIGYFVLPPSTMGCYFDATVNYVPEEATRDAQLENEGAGASSQALRPASVKHKTGAAFFGPEVAKNKEIWNDGDSFKIMYNRKEVGKSFCGAYIMILGDISQYSTITFMIKGAQGGETFQIGMNDSVSNKREDGVFIGAINRYLPGGVTRDWQLVKIPVCDFFGPDAKEVISLVFDFTEEGEGVFWIDDLRFYREALVFPMKDIYEKGYLLLDNYDHSYLNLLGRKTNTYKRLPSVCKFTLDKDVFYGTNGKSLRIDYSREGTGWCGYFSLLNQIDGEWYDLSGFDRVSFMVKGKKGGEDFEIGMADESWVNIGDSLKAGTIGKYLKNGVTTEWQEVVIPLQDFGLLDFSKMGAFVINFHRKQAGTIWIDDLKFYLKKENEEEENSDEEGF